MEKLKDNVWGIVGCGWLGTSLAETLIKEGKDIHGSTRSEKKIKKLEDMGITSHVLNETDMFDDQSWLNKLDVLVLNIPPSSFEDYPKAMASLAKQTNEGCKVIFVSSTSVYPNTNKWVDESTAPSGQNRNGPTIESAEKLLQSALGERLTILRMSGLVGGERNPIHYMAGKEIKGGNAPVNLVHRDDCIGVILKVVKESYLGETLNVCCSEHPTKKEYYEFISKKLNLPSPVFTQESNSFKYVSNEKSKKDLEYSYRFDSPFDFPH